MTKLYIAQIVLPKFGNDGSCINVAHSLLKVELCRMFGGFTALDSIGGWIDPQTGIEYLEDGLTYQTGMENNALAIDAIRKLAIRVGVMAGQIAMAVTLPNGEFEILQTGYRKDVGNA